MKVIQKTVYIVHGKGKELECQTKLEAIDKLRFLEEFFNHKGIFCLEERQKTEYEIEKGDRVYWLKNGEPKTDRIDIVTAITKDMFGSKQFLTKELNGNRIGQAYEGYLCLVGE